MGWWPTCRARRDSGRRGLAAQIYHRFASRFAALNITWMGLPAFEKAAGSRAILKDAGTIIKEYDPYDHPRATLAEATSGTFGNDPWASVLAYGTVDPNIGAVEHQLYGSPAINTAIHSSNDLWTAVMNGQYPASGSGPYMTAWFNLMTAGRYWELEPYFDLTGGRAVALEGVQYIVYWRIPARSRSPWKITATTFNGSIRQRASAPNPRATAANTSRASHPIKSIPGSFTSIAKAKSRAASLTSSLPGTFASTGGSKS